MIDLKAYKNEAQNGDSGGRAGEGSNESLPEKFFFLFFFWEYAYLRSETAKLRERVESRNRL